MFSVFSSVYLQKNLSITSFILLWCQTAGMLNTGVKAEAAFHQVSNAGWRKNEVRTKEWGQVTSLGRQKLGPCSNRHVPLWQTPNDVTYCQQLFTDQTGKERKNIYIAPFCTKVHTKCSGVDQTVLPANNTMPAFPSWHSPDVTTIATEAADIQLQLTTHLSNPKGWKAELA